MTWHDTNIPNTWHDCADILAASRQKEVLLKYRHYRKRKLIKSIVTIKGIGNFLDSLSIAVPVAINL